MNTAGFDYVLSARKEVIMAAGTVCRSLNSDAAKEQFKTPQLLMVSGVGPSATLDKLGIPVLVNRPGVGQNMWVSMPKRALLTNRITSPSAL